MERGTRQRGENMSIADNLARLRKDRGLSQQELAGKLNISQPYLCRCEAGEKIPALLTLLAISKALSCTLDELVKE